MLLLYHLPVALNPTEVSKFGDFQPIHRRISETVPDTASGGSRICKRGAKVERRRREDRGTEGLLNAPPQKSFLFRISRCQLLVLLDALFAVQLPVVCAKNAAFGLRKLAAAWKQTAKGGRASLLETIRGTIVSFSV